QDSGASVHESACRGARQEVALVGVGEGRVEEDEVEGFLPGHDEALGGHYRELTGAFSEAQISRKNFPLAAVLFDRPHRVGAAAVGFQCHEPGTGEEVEEGETLDRLNN